MDQPKDSLARISCVPTGGLGSCGFLHKGFLTWTRTEEWLTGGEAWL